jgi:hypothetical protein
MAEKTITPGAPELATAIAPVERAKNPPGRPKGLGRVPGSGRRKGIPNRGTIATREMILRKGNPIEFLIGVMNGNRFTAAPEEGSRKKSWAFPTMDQRLAAAQTLAKKVAADMKSIDLSAEDGKAPFVFQFISGGRQQ